MDVSQSIAQWKERSPSQWLGLANRILPPAATAALILGLAYSLAGLTWDLAPGGAFTAPLPEVASAAPRAAPAAGRDFAALAEAHLFGEAPPEDAPATAPIEVDAPDTTLNLELRGIVAISEPAADTPADEAGPGIAIIASGRDNGKVYLIGDTIEGASGARVHAVYQDRVLLNRGGQLEALRLPREAEAAAAPARRVPRPQPPQARGSLREVISENATRITEIMRLSPHLEQGEMVGFRVNPGRDRESFEALGLQPGDVVTEVNGMVVDDPARALQVYEALGEATMANVTVLRGGDPQVLVIDTTQLQNLAENLQ